jgi:hypothetical protein
MKRRRFSALALMAAGIIATPVAACDICAIYTATEMGESRTGFAPRGEHYSDYSTEKLDGDEVSEHRRRVATAPAEIIFGYQILPRLGSLNHDHLAHVSPLATDRTSATTRSGPGDLSLVANVLAFDRVSENSVFRFSLLGGLKLPSGDPDRIKEELAEGHQHEGAQQGGEHEEESGLHGHDLALGSGSVDGIVGGSIFWSWRRLFLTSALQYAIRTEGSFDYEYANDLTWSGGPGGYLLLTHDYTLSLQGLLTGESKGKDTLSGVKANDTGITALYAGPSFGFTWGTALSVELAADLPVVQNNTQLQLVPDYRLRGAAIWRFDRCHAAPPSSSRPRRVGRRRGRARRSPRAESTPPRAREPRSRSRRSGGQVVLLISGQLVSPVPGRCRAGRDRAARERVRVVAIGIDKDTEKADRFLAERVPHPAMTMVRDPDGALLARFGASGMPALYLLDRQGVVRLIEGGYDPDRLEHVEEEIEKLLAAPRD